MTIRRMSSGGNAPDDKFLIVSTDDLSEGVNTRTNDCQLPPKQAVGLDNVDLGYPGRRQTRLGELIIASDLGATTQIQLSDFVIENGTDQLLVYEATNIRKWESTGSWSSPVKSDFSAGATSVGMVTGKQSGIAPDDVVMISNGIDNTQIMTYNNQFQDLGDTLYSPPKSPVMCWYSNRFWVLYNDLLYFSDAYASTYSPMATITGDKATFTGAVNDKIKVIIDGVTHDNINIASCASIADVVTAINTAITTPVASVSPDGYLRIISPTGGMGSNVTIADGTGTGTTCIARLFYDAALRTKTGTMPWDRVSNAFRLPVGKEMALMPTRTSGIMAFGLNQIWSLAPSTVPSATTDFPQPMLTNIGCVAGNSVVEVGDDIFFMSQDGVRSIKRTMYDKLQLGQTFPLSYSLKTQFDAINWAYIENATAIYFDNKYFIALPADGNAYNSVVWVYYPAFNGWVTISGWNVGSFAVHKVDGQERLYYCDAVTGLSYRAWIGSDDAGTPITYTEISRAYNLEMPYQYKFGGVLNIRANSPAGLLYIYYNIDDQGWNLLGTFDMSGGIGVTFPCTFPVLFGATGTLSYPFHIDKTGRFREIKFKYVNSDGNGVALVDTTVLTHIDEFEEEAH